MTGRDDLTDEEDQAYVELLGGLSDAGWFCLRRPTAGGTLLACTRGDVTVLGAGADDLERAADAARRIAEFADEGPPPMSDPTRLTSADLDALRHAARVVARLAAHGERLAIEVDDGTLSLDPATVEVLMTARDDLFRASRTLSDAPRWAAAWRRWKG